MTIVLRPANAAIPHQVKFTARIQVRLTAQALRIVKRRSVNDFVIAAAQEVAQRTIDEAQALRLPPEDQKRFVELLLNPPALTPALKRARSAHARLIASSQ
jgi:uncharacterized protein (DUF1778 family)